MATKVNNKMVTCRQCGQRARFVQYLDFIEEQSAPVGQRLELQCPSGCQPDVALLLAYLNARR